MGRDGFEITVAICTYNRAASLAETLATVASLKVPKGLTWELLVVDNNSTDGTASVVDRYSSLLPLRCVREDRQGLSWARNRALCECRGDLLLFTDDDVRLDPGWLAAYCAAARSHPDADFFGGRILPLWTRRRPRWLHDEGMALIGGLLVYFDRGEGTRHLGEGDPLPVGASFAIRRRLFEKIEHFRTDLGVSGNVPGRGEEVEYLSRAAAAGSSGVYAGEALCHHVVDERRLRPGYLYRFGIQKGIAEARVNGGRQQRGTLPAQVGYAARGLLQLIRGRGDRWRQCIINVGIQEGLRREIGR